VPSDYRIAAMGDLSFSGREAGNAGVFRDFSPYAKSADYVFGNLEGVITERETSLKKYVPGRSYAFRFPASIAMTLRDLPVHAVTIANNHSNDYGPEGFRDTEMYLKEAGVHVTGLKGSYSVREVSGKRVGLIGFGFYSRQNDINQLEEAVALVKRVRTITDLLIVTFHGGAEGAEAAFLKDGVEVFLGEERGDPRRFARLVIRAGADIVVGHGPHVVRAAECVSGKPVIYSLGNFVSAGGLNIRKLANVTALLEAIFTADNEFKGVRLIPATFGEDRLPRFDPTGRGVHFVNWLGRRGEEELSQFEPIIFRGYEDRRSDFQRWLSQEGLNP
jgi:poly-gamma-glutamate synthesis protein (capsule biosynthesis protein)